MTSRVASNRSGQGHDPLCHTSVSKWTLVAGVEVTSKEKYERCAKVAGEVVFHCGPFFSQ